VIATAVTFGSARKGSGIAPSDDGRPERRSLKAEL